MSINLLDARHAVRHVMRCIMQEKRPVKLFQAVKHAEPEKMGVLLLHYKMKFEPLRFREKST